MISDFINYGETTETITNKLVSLMNELKLEVNNKYVNELIETHSKPLSNEYLIEKQQLSEIHNEKEEEETAKLSILW